MVNSELKDTIKVSFRRVKEHIASLEEEIAANRGFIIAQNKQIELQNTKILTLLAQMKGFQENKDSLSAEKGSEMAKKEGYLSNKSRLQSKNSIGNKGVSLDGYSLPGYSLAGYSLDIRRFKEELPSILSRLSKQEFLTFLTIYHQEDQDSKVTYESIANELKITPGCIRTYVSGLIKKGFPIVKTKYNNRIVILQVPAEIRSLNMKKRLIQMYYNLDPNQKKLNEGF